MTLSPLPQVNELQASVLAGDWAAAAKHVGRLELPSHAALQVRLRAGGADEALETPALPSPAPLDALTSVHLPAYRRPSL